jgi:hypothetical protein
VLLFSLLNSYVYAFKKVEMLEKLENNSTKHLKMKEEEDGQGSVKHWLDSHLYSYLL